MRSNPAPLGPGRRLRSFQIIVCLFLVVFSPTLFAGENPFANSQTTPPPSYKGPLFQLSYAYPKTPSPPPMPWRSTLNGAAISQTTAGAYANALRDAVAKDMQVLIGDYPHWNAAKQGWYNQPWLSSIREPIHGMFQATTTDASLFKDPKDPTYPAPKVGSVNNFGAVYYNTTAAATLGNFWGPGATSPNVTNTAAAQFAEGSLIVKLAFTEVTAANWPVMDGSPSWTIYAPFVDQSNPSAPLPPPTLFSVQLMQMDIIVKDTQASPKTGWVFTTLVYDHRVQGNFWDRMIPLGAMWGNDPGVNSSDEPWVRAALKETWINDASPRYALATLGWGGRLSGPNDGSVMAPGEYIDPATGNPGKVPVANSSCMSCHSPSQWPMQSNLQPGYSTGNLYYMFSPGSAYGFRWFQDRPGTEPMDAGSVALDYDMMFTLQALPAWASANGQQLNNLQLFIRPGDLMKKKQPAIKLIQRSYNGLPFKYDRPK